MQKTSVKKSISVLVSLLLLLSVFAVLPLTANAGDTETHKVILKGNADQYAADVKVSVSAAENTAGELVTVTIQKKNECVTKLRIPYCYISTDENAQPYQLSYDDYESSEWDPVTGEFTGTFRMSAQNMYVLYYIGEVEEQHEYGEWVYRHQGATADGDAYTGTRTCATCGTEDAEMRRIILEGNADQYAADVKVSVSAAENTAGELVTVTIQKKNECVTKLRIPYCYISTDENAQPYQLSYDDYESSEWDPVTGEFTGTFRMSAQNMYVLYYIGEVEEQHEYGEWIYSYQGSTADGDAYTGTRTCATCGTEDVESGYGYSIFYMTDGCEHGVEYLNIDGSGMYTAPAGATVRFTLTGSACSVLDHVEIKPYTPGDSSWPDEIEDCQLAYAEETGIYSFIVPHYPVFIVGVGDTAHNYEPVEYTETTATCTHWGTALMKKVCAVCGDIQYESLDSIPPFGHTAGDPSVENLVLPTADADGGFDVIVKCAACGEETSREHTVLEKLVPDDDHVPGKPVVENYAEPTAEKEGSFDVVVYCADCGEELSRESVTLPKLTPVSPEQPDTPDKPEPNDSADLCKYCGKDHAGSFIQRIVGFFHSILFFFAHLFGRK